MTVENKNNSNRSTQISSHNTTQTFVDKTFDWFKHKVFNSQQIDEDPTIRQRVVLLFVVTFIGSTTLILFCLLAFYQDALLLGSFDAIFALAFMLNIIDARTRRNYQFNILVGIVIASCLYIFLYANGGVNRTAFVWYFTFPLMASFLLGSKNGAIAMLLMAIPVIGLSLFDFRHSFFAQYSTTFEIRFLGAYFIIGLFAYMFEKAGENSRNEVVKINNNLENRVRHRTTQLTNLNQILLHEIEQHKHAQHLLTQSEQRYKTLIDLAAVGILIGSHDGHVLEANKCLCEIIGVESDDLIGKHISELAFTEESLQREPFRFDLLKAGEAVDRKRDILHPDGTKITIEMRTVMMPNKTYQAIFTDITERTKVEQNLRASEERFRLAFRTSPDSVNFNTVNDGTYVDINEGFTKILGYTRDDVIGKSSISLNIWKNIKDRRFLIQGLKKHGYIENLEAEFISKSGETKVGLMSARILRINEEDLILSITRDITEKKCEEKERVRVEELLQQAQKMEALGTLAGGIAHDFNNLLMGIQGRISLMAMDLQPTDPGFEHIKAIDQHVHSASNLTDQLLGTARGGKYNPRPTELNELIESSAAMFGRTRKEISIHTHHSVNKISAVVDRSQIEQVLLNLYVNAWQAMPHGGLLKIESDVVNLKKEYSKLHKIDPGHFAKISVTDTGGGMDKNTQQQIFDPFFTTKEKGRGTGLGLASAYGIIKNHDGFITVNSEIGRGTTFTFFLPLSELEPLREPPTESTLVKGCENILLVDDEEIILDVGTAMLQVLGYSVTCVPGGEEAIEHIKQVGEKIDLVILDLIMPGIDGGRTFDRIREIYPSMPVMLSSGYAIDGQAEEIMARGCNGFMQKPFSLPELSVKIRNILDKKV
jgi:PAS domain S-box-containing protein